MNISAERCLIRRFEARDIAGFMAYRNDMDWMKFQGFKGLSRQAYCDTLLGGQTLQDGIQLAVICKKTDALIGDIYLKQEGAACWIGYSICRAMARQGYAYEAVCAVIAALKQKGVSCIKAGIERDNTASIALIQKLNFRYIGMDKDEQLFMLQL